MRTMILGDVHLGDAPPGDGGATLGAPGLAPLLESLADAPVRLVLNGDVVDFVRASARTTGLDPDPALPQIDAIISRWPRIFRALARILARGGEIVWRIGSRDLPLSLLAVQQRVRHALGEPTGLRFEPVDQPTILRVGAAKILVTHGAHADPAERVRFAALPDDGAAAPDFRSSAGVVRARHGLMPLAAAGVRFAELVGPHAALGVLAAAAIDPQAFAQVRSAHGLRVDWDALLGRRAPQPAPDPLDLTPAIELLNLDAVELSEMRAALTRGHADGVDRWRIAALRAWAARQGRDGGRRLQPLRAEWMEARRLRKLFDVDAVVLGHTHLPRWGNDAGLLYVNPGAWLPRLTVPPAREDDAAWAEWISRLARDRRLEGAASDGLRCDAAVVCIEPKGAGAAISLERWRDGALQRMDHDGTACLALLGTGTTSFTVRRPQERRRCRPLVSTADHGRPLLDPGALPGPGLLFPVERRPPGAERSTPHGNPHDLADQLWGVVVARGHWPVYRDALAPLIELREAEMDARAPVIEVPPEAVIDLPRAVAWVSAHWLTRTHDQRPGYLLLLGDLIELPLALQQVLATVCCVGRLAFTSDTGTPDLSAYRAYADKVVRWSVRPAPVARAPLNAWVAEDGSRAIDAGLRALVEPALGTLTRDSAQPFSAVKRLVLPWMQPAPEQLLAHPALGDTQLLFTLAHGAAPPRRGWDRAARRMTQGALGLGGGVLLDADAVAAEPPAAGGIWFAFGSFSAGTAPQTAYGEWLAQLDTPDARRLALAFEGPPFIAAVPQAALAHEQGPLAFVGHVDIAWTFGWQVSLPGSDLQLHDRISLVMAALGGGRSGVWPRGGPGRIGHAVRQLGQAAARYADMLAERRRTQPAATDHLDGAIWLARQDLESYVLLGDPAVHLPLTAPTATGGRIISDAPTRPDQRPTPNDAVVRALLRQSEPELVQRFLRAARATLRDPSQEADVLACLAGEPLGAEIVAAAARYLAAGRRAWGLDD